MSDSMSAPALSALDVTPADGADLSRIARGLYIGVGGNVKVDMSSSGTVTFVGVGAGTLLPIYVKRVYATGTTATNIIALL